MEKKSVEGHEILEQKIGKEKMDAILLRGTQGVGLFAFYDLANALAESGNAGEVYVTSEAKTNPEITVGYRVLRLWDRMPRFADGWEKYMGADDPGDSIGSRPELASATIQPFCNPVNTGEEGSVGLRRVRVVEQHNRDYLGAPMAILYTLG